MWTHEALLDPTKEKYESTRYSSASRQQFNANLLTTDSNGSNRRKRGFPKIHAKITDKGMTNKAICFGFLKVKAMQLLVSKCVTYNT